MASAFSCWCLYRPSPEMVIQHSMEGLLLALLLLMLPLMLHLPFPPRDASSYPRPMALLLWHTIQCDTNHPQLKGFSCCSCQACYQLLVTGSSIRAPSAKLLCRFLLLAQLPFIACPGLCMCCTGIAAAAVAAVVDPCLLHS